MYSTFDTDVKKNYKKVHKLRPTNLSELTPIVCYMELTHLGSETTKYKLNNFH